MTNEETILAYWPALLRSPAALRMLQKAGRARVAVSRGVAPYRDAPVKAPRFDAVEFTTEPGRMQGAPGLAVFGEYRGSKLLVEFINQPKKGDAQRT